MINSKKAWLLVGLLVAFAVTLTGCNGARVGSVSAGSTSRSNIVKNLEPAVVRIDTAGPSITSAGSGFFVDARGYVLTNNHVVAGSTLVKVTVMDGTVYNADIVAADTQRDLAMLRLASSRRDFAVAVLGSSAAASVGDELMAAGFPLGNDLPGPATFSKGMVSAFRVFQGLNYIQTDVVTINPGSSGGPLVDMEGKVVAIAVAGIIPLRIDAEGIGLAIPIDEAKPFVKSSLGK